MTPPAADLRQPRLRQNPADQTVGRRRRGSHHSGAEQAAAALSGRAVRLAGYAARSANCCSTIRRSATSSSSPREDWSALWRLTPFISYARLGREAARHPLRSGDRHARAIPHRDLYARAPARRCGSASTGRAREVWDASPRVYPRRNAQARLARRAGGKLARLHAPHSGADARSAMPSTAISTSGRFAWLRRRPGRLFVSDSGRSRGPGRRASRPSSRGGQKTRGAGARHDLGNQTWRSDRLRRGGAPFAAKRICRGTDRRWARARQSATRSEARAGRQSISPAKPR